MEKAPARIAASGSLTKTTPPALQAKWQQQRRGL
jgi:hypothetical protein